MMETMDVLGEGETMVVLIKKSLAKTKEKKIWFDNIWFKQKVEVSFDKEKKKIADKLRWDLLGGATKLTFCCCLDTLKNI